MPDHPAYIISKGRAHNCMTARSMLEDGVPFALVVEPVDEAAYRDAGFGDHLAVLPFSDLGQGSIPARNWVWEDALAAGASRHWILDDNIYFPRAWRDGARHRVSWGEALHVGESVVESFANVAVGGLNYDTFAQPGCEPFQVNTHVYSCLLVRNDLPYRWRGRYNEDADLCLQVLAGGWCTVLLNTYVACKKTTLTMRGGNATELYKGDGRLRMARALERAWPGVVKVVRRFNRPQHFVDWSVFDTPLVLADSPEAEGWSPRDILGEPLPSSGG